MLHIKSNQSLCFKKVYEGEEDAQKNPRNYLDLMVKVSGYSYRFIDQTKDLQDDILARTEFEIWIGIAP